MRLLVLTSCLAGTFGLFLGEPGSWKDFPRSQQDLWEDMAPKERGDEFGAYIVPKNFVHELKRWDQDATEADLDAMFEECTTSVRAAEKKAIDDSITQKCNDIWSGHGGDDAYYGAAVAGKLVAKTKLEGCVWFYQQKAAVSRNLKDGISIREMLKEEYDKCWSSEAYGLDSFKQWKITHHQQKAAVSRNRKDGISIREMLKEEYDK